MFFQGGVCRLVNSKKSNVLVTGGTGYIGSHTCVELLNNNYNIIIIDNLVNSSAHVVEKIKKISGTNQEIKFYNFDLRDKNLLRKVFAENEIDMTIHFAGLKAVGESVAEPIKYYDNNLMSSLVLCEVMSEFGVKKIVFSSSATVYGVPKSLPIKEDFELQTTNPYGSTKLMIENILRDLYVSDEDWGIVLLRYFNPVGAHESGLIGEDPKGIPNNLMPYISRVASGELECLNVFGNDYDTHDGTGVRDYIHVVDLAKGHLKAMNKIKNSSGVYTYNLGTGRGFSVLDLVKSFEKTNNLKIKYKIVARRPGDIASCYADPLKAKEELGWAAEKNIDDICRDSWNFIKNKNI